MGPLLVLVFPCLRENKIVTCNIASFVCVCVCVVVGVCVCSLDNFLLKNVIVSFFGNQFSKWGSFEKRAIFDQLHIF